MSLCHRLLLLACLSAMLVGCSYRDSSSENETDKASGRIIIRAIQQYHIDHQSFPQTLERLVPYYVANLPRTTYNRSFDYRTFHDSSRGDDYELCFVEGEKLRSTGYGCCYMHFFDNPPQYDGWDCTAGHP